MKGVFIFRRDLRLDDNTGLLRALKTCKEVLPLFIIDPRQSEPHDYRSEPGLQFLQDSLQDLDEQLKKKGSSLVVRHGKAHDVLDVVLKETGAEAVFVNQDYTPFAYKRDAKLKVVCTKHDAVFVQEHDYLLTIPGSVMTKDDRPYTIFTFFRKAAERQDVPHPVTNKNKNYFTIKTDKIDLVCKRNKHTSPGGRTHAKSILKQLDQFEHYKEERDIPALDKTTHLSAHHKFGTISVRESYWTIRYALGPEHGLLNELYWRDFFTHVAHHFPHVFGRAFNEKYDGIAWKQDAKAFKKWCEGKTGFPIVDAGMRQLNATGYMHNRVRMIVASFLTKDLHIDWRLGEKYFAQKLVDYDPCVNNGNWQWAASTGCDAQPYFRIFNPWRQQERFDPYCVYIKEWVEELRDAEPAQIHKHDDVPIDGYVLPMLDHKTAAAAAKELFKK